jgi:hypothetical protein
VNGLVLQGKNRYLVDEAGRDLSTRGPATLRAFGFLLLSLTFGVGAGLTTSLVWPAVVLGLLSFASFVASPIFMWIRILRGGRLIEEATVGWHHSNVQPGSAGAELVLPAARYVLREVFRSDFRVRAFHLLGLLAEQQGAFDEAQDLFARAEAALPSMAAPARKRDARVLIAAHRALCLLALGQRGAARALLERGSRDVAPAAPGLLDALDDSSWGLGSASLNEVLMKMEARRPPRAILGLAWALLHLAEGNPSVALQLYQGERQMLDQGLFPRERALLERVHDVSAASLGAGPHRSPGLTVRGDDGWTGAVLKEIAQT